MYTILAIDALPFFWVIVSPLTQSLLMRKPIKTRYDGPRGVYKHKQPKGPCMYSKAVYVIYL